jgi:hypothetical protein
MSHHFTVDENNNIIEIKRCRTCYKVKRIEDFRIQKSTRKAKTYYRPASSCKDCEREITLAYLKNRYARDEVWRNKQKHNFIQHQWRRLGIKYEGNPFTWKIYDILLEYQNHKCAICKESDWFNSLHVDHYHKTGEVRGLLCGGCNRRAVGTYERTGHYRTPKHEKLIQEYLSDPPVNHISSEHVVKWNGVKKKEIKKIRVHQRQSETILTRNISEFEIEE